MGKKGKRSRRKAVSTADRASIVAVQTKIEEIIVKTNESSRLQLDSQAANELQEGIQLIEATMLESSDTLLKMNLQTWFVENKMLSYSNLIAVEFNRRNFDRAIQIYKNLFERGDIKMKMKILSPIFPSLRLTFHEALLRQGKRSIDTFISLSKLRITHARNDDQNLESDLTRSADFLRLTKHFDAAVVLGKQLEVLNGDILSITTTYLDQYIVGGKFPPADDFTSYISNLFQKHKNGFKTDNAAAILVLAQSTYLLNQLFDDTEEVFGKSIGFIKEYLDLISNVQSYCITCKQTATESEVQFVCSGCRVACYCSLDHQRMSWKKEAERGMRFGHEVLCPVMKAYRKFKNAYFNGEDDKKMSRLRRRFERECLYLLSDGLGLKHKCFK